jgi:PAS domain S-box-containing protein
MSMAGLTLGALVRHTDYLWFALLALSAFFALHIWLEYSRRGQLSLPTWGLCVCILVGGSFLTDEAGRRERWRLQKMVEGIAPTYAQELELMGHARVTLDTDPNDPLYLALIEAQIRWLHANPNVADIYTFRKTDEGKAAFLVDSETDYDHNNAYEGEREGRTEIGEEYKDVDDNVERAFQGESTFSEQPTTDRWGTWVSAQVPMFDENGQVEAVLGVDYTADDWVKGIAWARLSTMLFLAVLQVILGAAAVIVALVKADMAARKQAEEALRQSEERFRSLIENAQDLIAIISQDGVLRYCSPSVARVLGYSQEDLLERHMFPFVHEEDLPRVQEAITDILRTPGKSCSAEYRFLHKDGSWRTLESMSTNLLDEPAIGGLVFNSRDVTERRAAEKLKDELVSTVSHELRTPLTSIRGFAELMRKREYPPEKRQEFLSVIQTEATRLTKLINDFLDIQRIESGKQTYDLQWADLLPLLEQSLTVFRGAGGDHLFQFVHPDRLPSTRIDGDRIQQVLANFLSNAVKFSPHGGTITLGAKHQGEELVVWVADQGVGIPPEALSKLFGKFYRVNNEDTRSIGGTGLGLALVKKIIEAHGGRVWVESTPGKGSTFFFSLPATVEAGHDERR